MHEDCMLGMLGQAYARLNRFCFLGIQYGKISLYHGLDVFL